MSWFTKSLEKTRVILTTPVDELFTGKKAIDDDLLERLEETLITADLGVATAMELMDAVQEGVDAKTITDAKSLKKAMAEEIRGMLESCRPEPFKVEAKPHVIMMVGVNGVGKTTSIGKLAARFKKDGFKTMLVAGDTFRAAAIEQLEIWSERVGVDIVRHHGTTDPAAVVFDGIEAARARGMDVVLVDTAGRLHTRVNLMEELKKVKRTAAKKMPGAPHDTWIVIDASTGQNAIQQAKLFHEAVGLTGIILAKLDGTAKGGVVLPVCRELDVPLRYVGLGEQINDLAPFDPDEFVEALF